MPDATESAATSVHGLRDVVKRLAAFVDQRFAAGELGTLRAVYNRYKSISEQVPTDEQILPIDLSKIRESALAAKMNYDRQLPDPVLMAGLISQTHSFAYSGSPPIHSPANRPAV